MRLLLALVMLMAFSQPPLDGPRYYVNAEHGLNIRQHPSQNAMVLGKIPFGTLLNHQNFIEMDSLKKSYNYITKQGGKTWLHLSYNEVKGFVSMEYLVYYNPRIWDSTLYDFFSANIGKMSSYNGGQGITKNRYNQLKDSLKTVIDISLVDINDYLDKGIFSFYSIDTTPTYKRVPYPLKEATKKYGEAPVPDIIPHLNSFYIYFENGDSAYFEDSYGKMSEGFDFVGRIPAINKYVIQYHSEIGGYFLIDIKTGEGKDVLLGPADTGTENAVFTQGKPYISPDGKHLVQFATGTYSYYPTLVVTHFDKESIKSDSIITSVIFKTWAVDMEDFQPFWVSNNEMVFRAQPINNDGELYNRTTTNVLGDSSTIVYQYIKLTIL